MKSWKINNPTAFLMFLLLLYCDSVHVIKRSKEAMTGSLHSEKRTNWLRYPRLKHSGAYCFSSCVFLGTWTRRGITALSAAVLTEGKTQCPVGGKQREEKCCVLYTVYQSKMLSWEPQKAHVYQESGVEWQYNHLEKLNTHTHTDKTALNSSSGQTYT